MALDVKISLPNNLKSGYLQSEFISSGLGYTVNKYSSDPNLSENANQIVLGFELRSTDTRDIVNLSRINTLYLSNDPYFEQSSTVKINNWPAIGQSYDSNYNYIYNLNSDFFFNNSLSQGSFGSTEAGAGLFKINNWPLSANGGISRVYVKAVIEGPGGTLVEYPNGYGIYDTIYWEGVLPSSPSQLNYSTYKSGWVGKNTKGNFYSANALSSDTNNGINSYLLSLYELQSIGNTYEIYSANTSIKRSFAPDTDTKPLGYTSYGFYYDGANYNYSADVLNIGDEISLLNSGFGQGVFYYSDSTLSFNSNEDVQAQAGFSFTNGSIGSTSHLYFKLSENTDESNNGTEYVLQLDIPGKNNPIAKFYTIINGSVSANSQITVLPSYMLKKFKNGGLLELYSSNIGTQYSFVESFFTPNEDQNDEKSYLLSNAIVPNFAIDKIGFGYQIETTGNETNKFTLNELVMSSGKNILSADIGNLTQDDFNYIGTPVVKITNTWITDDNIEYFTIEDTVLDFHVTTTKYTNYLEIEKIDENNIYDLPIILETQFSKASLSNKCSLEVLVTHKSDDFYVAFSNKSSYRPHIQNGIQVEWDRPIGSRCLDNYSYSNLPIDASTIMVKFDANKNVISIIQRDYENKFYKHNLKSYKPNSTEDRFLIEITDQIPSNLKGLKNSRLAEGTWIYVKTITGNKVDTLGYAQLSTRVPSDENGLGYYAACGFIKSDYDNTSGVNYNQISEVILRSLVSTNIDQTQEYKNIKIFNLTPEGLSNSKQFLGVHTLSANTNFKDFGYKNPVSISAAIEVSAVSIGSNIDLTTIASSTIDGVAMSSLDIDSYIILKDQEDDDQNGLYKKTFPSVFEKQTASYNVPYQVVSGNVNANSVFYLVRSIINNKVDDRFISTNYFTKLKINQISPVTSITARPELFEFKLNQLDYVNTLDLDSLKIRFYENSNNVPDYDNPLTDWLSINNDPVMNDTFVYAPNSNLVQVKLNNFANLSPLVSSNDEIWVQIAIPFNTSLGKSYGPDVVQDIIVDGKFSNYKIANNLWHKLSFKRYEKFENSSHGNIQHLRLRALTNGLLQSHATKLTDPHQIDILGPSSGGDLPSVENLAVTSTRSVNLSINAEDDSGIMAFRVGKDIDNFRVQYTPWMNWQKFSVDDGGVYSIYLYGNMNYYNDGSNFTSFDIQNMGFSGPRKIWVQLMDYCGNVSESYPITFVAQAWYLVDTLPPIGSVKFWNTKTNQASTLTNLSQPIVKINADDIVSGVKDFKYRKISDNGPQEWSDWEMLIPYKLIDYSNTKDGVKKLEFAFRDYGNNISQPSMQWEKVTRPKK